MRIKTPVSPRSKTLFLIALFSCIQIGLGVALIKQSEPTKVASIDVTPFKTVNTKPLMLENSQIEGTSLAQAEEQYTVKKK